MEILCELLWKACSWLLLSFLVERLISLLVCLSKDDSVSGSNKEEGTKRSATIYHCDYHDHEHDEDVRQEQFTTGIYSKEKRVVFVDQANESAEFQQVDFDILSSELKYVGSTEKDKVMLGRVFIGDSIEGFDECDEESEGKKRVKNIEEEVGKFGKELVDQIEEEEKKIVGLKDKFGVELESGKNSADVYIKDVSLGLKEKQCHETDVILGSKRIVDDERKGENSSNVREGEISGREFNKDEGILSDDEEWEGIERSELEKKFAKAMNLMDKEGKLLKGDNDVNMQLYGLQKIAMEGPCHEPQPMALKLSARAKWNAWQRLGNMTREDAMEQYITLLSENSFEGVEDDHSLVERKSSSSGIAVDSDPGAN